jgi:hypothetical protein
MKWFVESTRGRLMREIGSILAAKLQILYEEKRMKRQESYLLALHSLFFGRGSRRTPI